jgi:hypothetical protein
MSGAKAEPVGGMAVRVINPATAEPKDEKDEAASGTFTAVTGGKCPSTFKTIVSDGTVMFDKSVCCGMGGDSLDESTRPACCVARTRMPPEMEPARR